MIVKDSWPAFAIGWRPAAELHENLNIEIAVVGVALGPPPDGTSQATWETQKKFDLEKDMQVIFYRDVTRQALDAYLTPTKAVIESLTDSVQHWNTRHTVTPLTSLPAGQLAHVTVSKPKAPKTPSQEGLKSEFWDREVSYAVSYVNQYGEGSTSDWTPFVKVKSHVEKVHLHLGPVAYEGDTTLALSL